MWKISHIVNKTRIPRTSCMTIPFLFKINSSSSVEWYELVWLLIDESLGYHLRLCYPNGAQSSDTTKLVFVEWFSSHSYYQKETTTHTRNENIICPKKEQINLETKYLRISIFYKKINTQWQLYPGKQYLIWNIFFFMIWNTSPDYPKKMRISTINIIHFLFPVRHCEREKKIFHDFIYLQEECLHRLQSRIDITYDGAKQEHQVVVL